MTKTRIVTDTETAEFVRRMTSAHAGRDMVERVFRQIAGPGAVPVQFLRDDELATYLLARDWTFSDVIRRES